MFCETPHSSTRFGLRAALLITLLLSAFGGIAYAQDVEVPIDTDGTLYAITAPLESHLLLFPNIPGFLEARLFESPGSSFVLQVEYRVDGRLHLERRPLSLAEVRQFRQEVADALATRMPAPSRDQSGRTKLMLGSAALALGYHGWAIPSAFEVDEGRTAVGIYTLISASGFFAPYLATRDRPVSQAQASLALYGATRGIAHGMMGTAAADAQRVESYFAAGSAVGIVEGVAGFAAAGMLDMTHGTAELTGSGGDLGGGIGLGVAVLAGMFDETDTGRRESGWGAGIAGSFLGMVGGYRLAMTEPYTPGDNSIFRAASLVGGYTGYATALALGDYDDEDLPKATVAAALVGSGAGAYIGRRLVHHRNFRNSHGTFVTLGTAGGGLLGAGIGYLIKDNDEKAILFSSAMGAMSGLAILYSSFAGDANRQSGRAEVDIQFDPVALLIARSGRLPAHGSTSIASVRVRF